MIRVAGILLLLGAISCPAATLTREGWAVTEIDQLLADDQTITFTAKDETPISQIILDFSNILHRDIVLKKNAIDTKVTVRVHGQAIECFEEILGLGGYALKERGRALIVEPIGDEKVSIETHFIHGYRLSKTGDTRPSIAAVLDSCRNILRIQPDPANEVLNEFGELVGWQAGPRLGNTRVTYNPEEGSLAVQGTQTQHQGIEDLVDLLAKESTAFSVRIGSGDTETIRARERIRISENAATVATTDTQEWVLEQVGNAWIPKDHTAPTLVYPGSSILLWLDEDGTAHIENEVVQKNSEGRFKKTTSQEALVPLTDGTPINIPLGTSEVTLAVNRASPTPPIAESVAALRNDISSFPR